MGRTTVVDVKLGTEGRQLDWRLLGAHPVGPLCQLVSEPAALVPRPLSGLSHTAVPVTEVRGQVTGPRSAEWPQSHGRSCNGGQGSGHWSRVR